MLDVHATIKKVNARQRCDSCSGPAYAKTRPVRALYNPDGRHTYVGRFVRSAAYAYKWFRGREVVVPGSTYGQPLHVLVGPWVDLLSASRGQTLVLNESVSYAFWLVGLVVVIFVSDCQGDTTMKALCSKTIFVFVPGFPVPDWHWTWASPR